MVGLAGALPSGPFVRGAAGAGAGDTAGADTATTGVAATTGAAGFTGIRAVGHGAEVGLGLFPWVDHPRMPEAVQFRLQRLFARLGPAVARRVPAASLHLVWRMEKAGADLLPEMG